MVERSEIKRIFLTAVNNRKAETCNNILKARVDENSIIFSDCWKGYKDVCKNFQSHFTVNHSKYFVDPDTSVHTNSIEGNWCGLKLNAPYRLRTKEKIIKYLLRYMLLRNEIGHPLINLIKYLYSIYRLKTTLSHLKTTLSHLKTTFSKFKTTLKIKIVKNDCK